MEIALAKGILVLGLAALMITSAQVAVAQPVPSRIVGQLTKSNGDPVAGASVYAVSTNGLFRYSAQTQADGSYVIPDVGGHSTDQYKVRFDPRFVNGLPDQWAHRKKTEAEADVFEVTPGQDTVVSDSLFPTGTAKFSASDAVTSAPVTSFCVEASGASILRRGCTQDGTVTLADMPLGDYRTRTEGYPDYFDGDSTVSVVAGQVAEVHTKLAPVAKISTTVVDAVTKAPVPNACVYAKSKANPTGDFPFECSGPDGRVTVTRLTTGIYELWVEPGDKAHGAQWVGPNGGIGNHLQARSIPAPQGRTTTIAPILLDGAGSISGTVVDRSSGAPVAGVCAFPRAGYAYDQPIPPRPDCTKQDGKYTVSGLGPYRWPVNFIDNVGSHAWQWSGGQPSQVTARHIKVNTGQTATADESLAEGTTLSGKLTDNGVSGYLTLHNAITGDRVAGYTFPDANGDYTFKNIAGYQAVKIAFNEAQPPYRTTWYVNSATFAAARGVSVRAGTPVTGIDFTITPR